MSEDQGAYCSCSSIAAVVTVVKTTAGGVRKGQCGGGGGVMLVLVGGERGRVVRWVSEQVRSEDVEEEVEGRCRYDTSGNHNSRSCDNAVVRLIACSCSNERPTSASLS